MEWGLGVLRWSPSEFWQATPYELSAAIRGYQEAHSAKPDPDPPESDPATADARLQHFLMLRVKKKATE